MTEYTKENDIMYIYCGICKEYIHIEDQLHVYECKNNPEDYPKLIYRPPSDDEIKRNPVLQEKYKKAIDLCKETVFPKLCKEKEYDKMV